MNSIADIRLRRIFYLLFAFSGLTGLIYESIWSHYMKLFLGHAAYAQTLVLAIFMGGMAIGSWLCSKYSSRWKDLFLWYVIVEGVIGLFALVFHNVFDEVVRFSYTEAIPYMGTPAGASVYKWVLSSLLILPQSVLIGMPFPLMSAAILRIFPKKPDRTVAMLYFCNTLGAAIGVLISGFLLVRLVGLPGTIRIAGAINLALAFTVWFLSKGQNAGTAFETKAVITCERFSVEGCHWPFLIASLLTGTASFIYEIGWIRMLSLVLGSSTHSFELMLSAFIFGLAFGGLWIKSRFNHIKNPVLYLITIQIVMGLLALLTLPLYGKTFEIMQWLMNNVSKTETGYLIYNLSGYSIALAVMLPTTFCAGMTLPLITSIVMGQGKGERSIGMVYAANTVGAIIGIFFAVHVGLPFLGLKGLIISGGVLDIGIGLALLWIWYSWSDRRIPVTLTNACVCVVLAVVFLVSLNQHKMASGVYRQGHLLDPANNKILFHKDGETASVSLSLSSGGLMSIITNGKVDAGLYVDSSAGPTPDEVTMVLAAAIPMAINPQAETAANIGLGSGLTTQILLDNQRMKHVDTVEIESSMVEAAKHYGPWINSVFTDPRSEITIDDAKSFFSVHNNKYDIIISEPSNPWVSGVANLFSEEFYELISRHMTEQGLFVQWLQLYEIDVNLVASVMKSVSTSFTDYAIYAANDTNILIICRNSGRLADPDPAIFGMEGVARALKRINIVSVEDIDVRKMGSRQVYGGLFETFPIHANSDYYPVLDQYAVRSRFLKHDALELHQIPHNALPLMDILSGQRMRQGATEITPSVFLSKTESVFNAMALRDYFMGGAFDGRYENVPFDIREQAQKLNALFNDKRGDYRQDERIESLFDTATRIMPYLRPHELAAIWSVLESRSSGDLLPIERAWIAFFKAAGNRDARTMAIAAQALLTNGQQMPLYAVKYLTAAAMLGHLASGESGQALEIWNTYQKPLFAEEDPGIVFRLLLAGAKDKNTRPEFSSVRLPL